MHVLRVRAATLDWTRLAQRYADNWQLLHSYLVLFTFVYPSEAANLPAAVMDDLAQRSRFVRRPMPIACAAVPS